MIRTRLAVALTSLAVISSANAGFHFNSTDQGVVDGYRVFLIRALNDGIGTGYELDGYDLTFTVSGARAHFNVIDGHADLINTSNPNLGFMRVGSPASTSIVYTSPPRSEGAQWESIQSWNVAAISTGSEVATGNGAIIARLFLDGPAFGQLTGQIGGNQGEPQIVNTGVFLGIAVDDFDPPVVTANPSSVTIDLSSQTSFGPVVVNATDGSDIISLAAGTIPIQIADNLSITGDTDGPLTINGSGFGPDDVGSYTIDFTAMAAAGPATIGMGIFVLNVVIPEPTTLSLLAGLSLLLRRRN